MIFEVMNWPVQSWSVILIGSCDSASPKAGPDRAAPAMNAAAAAVRKKLRGVIENPPA